MDPVVALPCLPADPETYNFEILDRKCHLLHYHVCVHFFSSFYMILEKYHDLFQWEML